MKRLDHLFVLTEQQEKRMQQIGKLADSFAADAHRIDAEHGFAFEHIEALRKLNYFSDPVPKAYGGAGLSLYELVLYQERLAQGDAPTALGAGWHLSVVHDFNYKQPWSKDKIAQINSEIVQRQVLLNKAVTEKTSGSPTRGGKPLTAAKRLADGSYMLNGRKTFTTLSPVLDYFIVVASLEDEEGTAEFIIPRDAAGLTIDETWHMAGMRGTASHDLVLEDAIVPETALLCRIEKKAGRAATPSLLHIPACYLGIALAARKEAIKFAHSYHPNSLPHPIIHLPHIQQQLGQIELELQTARHFLYSVAARWDRLIAQQGESNKLEVHKNQGQQLDNDMGIGQVAQQDLDMEIGQTAQQRLSSHLGQVQHSTELLTAELNAVKVTAINTALSVVDKAMRIVGAHSLALDHPLQRMYRDVRFGLHNPPMEDAVLGMLGRLAIADLEGSDQA